MKIEQPAYPPPNGTPAYRDLKVVTDLIIHHSDGPEDQSPLAIDQEHRGNGWVMIGYHYVIAGDGTISEGRPLGMVPAAAQDDNTDSIDVCVLGDFQPGTDGYNGSPTPAQLASLKELSVYLHKLVPSIERTIGHRDVAGMEHDPSVATSCPGDTLYALIPQIKAA